MDRKPFLWIVAVIVALVATWQLASAQAEKEKAVQKLEYKVVVIYSDGEKREKVLADAGDAGWELVSASPGANPFHPHLYFKRLK
jgi:hypothetical protein